MRFKDSVSEFIARHRLLHTQSPILVALSGGADSVALLHVLQELGYKLIALHCNFHLRGQESDRDEAFVKALCQTHHIPLEIKHFNTTSYAHRHAISIEMAARELRYTWFTDMMSQTDSQAIAVGHHINDQAETLLLHLIRGCGINGLCGMLPRQGSIVRPLLCVTKEHILEYISEKHEHYVTDSSNLEREAQRNIIRLDIMPLLRSLNPRIEETLSRTCDLVQDCIPLYNKGVSQTFGKNGVTHSVFPKSLIQEPSAGTLLHEWIAGQGFTRQQEQDMLKHDGPSSGHKWNSPYKTVIEERDRLFMTANKTQAHPISLQYQIVDHMGDTGPDKAYFDADLLSEPLYLRKVRAGDRICPFGMTGSKLISDLMTERKMNLLEKERQMVLCCGENIIWVIGLRSDNRYRITSKTRHILSIKLTNH